MALTDAAKTIMLNALGQAAVSVSLHTSDPLTTGVNEVTGGSYVRQAISWNSPQAGGTMAAAVNPLFNVPGGITVNYWGLWKSDGITFLGGGPVSNPETYVGAGTFTLSTADIAQS